MNFGLLKRRLRKFILGYDISTYFFSQGGEDAILLSLFHKKIKNKEKGFFIDVGAYHPYRHSNTFLFYLNGWRGINIDPSPGSMKVFNKVRPGDINLEIGVGSENQQMPYYLIDEDSTMNTFSKENLLNHGMYKYVKKEISIDVKTLKTVLKEYPIHNYQIDLLSIDVEGLDYEVLLSNDWDLAKPNVIVVELECSTINDLVHNKSAQFLVEQGYKIVAKNVILNNVASVFFVSDTFEY